jgi:hypothetical protein
MGGAPIWGEAPSPRSPGNVRCHDREVSMNALLVNPRFPQTFRSFIWALERMGRNVRLPESWNMGIVDVNVREPEMLRKRFPGAVPVMKATRDDMLAFLQFPQEHWRKIWSTNPLECLAILKPIPPLPVGLVPVLPCNKLETLQQRKQ